MIGDAMRRRLLPMDPDSGSDSSFGAISLRRYKFPEPHSEAYKEVLIDKHEVLMEELTLDNTIILDKLTEDSVLSENEAISFRREANKKDRVRSLLLTLADRGLTAFKSFIKSLQYEYPHLSMELANSLETREAVQMSRIPCVVCRIKSNVDCKEVIDKFYQRRILSTKDMKVITKCTKELGWCQLRPELQKKPKAKDALVDALSKKYPELSREYSAMPSHKFACFCKALENKAIYTPNVNNEPRNTSSMSTGTSSASSTSSPCHSFRKKAAEQAEPDSTTDITGSLPLQQLHMIDEDGDVFTKQYQDNFKRRKYSSEIVYLRQSASTITRHNSLPHTLTRGCGASDGLCPHDDTEGTYDNNIPLVSEEIPAEGRKYKLHRRDAVRRKGKRVLSGT